MLFSISASVLYAIGSWNSHSVSGSKDLEQRGTTDPVQLPDGETGPSRAILFDVVRFARMSGGFTVVTGIPSY
jgi:hypothetical protein